MKLRLAYLLPTLPRYSNNKTKGEYKNGNYKGLFITVDSGRYKRILIDEDIPKELFEKPWYVDKIVPGCTSAYGSHANSCLYIVLNKEEN